MHEETGALLLSDGGSSVLFHPPQPYPDGCGFHHRVELKTDSFNGTIDASSYETLEALRPFRDQLLSLYKSLIGEAVLPRSYENLTLTMKGDGLGHITLQVVARAYNYTYAELSFSFAIDQTQLPAAIAWVGRFLP